MREHQGAVPWLRLSMEGAAIVLSILLAFGIDAGWDFRAQLNEERDVLTGLRAEFEDVRARLDGWAEFNGVAEEVVSRALATDPGTLSHPLADSVLSAVWLVNIIDRGGGPLDALLASGRLELIRERRIRERVARWPDRMEDLHTNDLGTTDFVLHQILPSMADFGLPEVLCSGRVPFCVHDGPIPQSHSALLADRRFRALLTTRLVVLRIIGDDQKAASAAATELITLIDEYLDR